MKSAKELLPEDIEKLKMLLLPEPHQAELKDAQKDQDIERLKQSYQNLLEQFRLAQYKRFGPSGESSDQLGLFNEAEVEIEKEPVEEDTLAADNQLRKQRPNRKPLLRELPRERVAHESLRQKRQLLRTRPARFRRRDERKASVHSSPDQGYRTHPPEVRLPPL